MTVTHHLATYNFFLELVVINPRYQRPAERYHRVGIFQRCTDRPLICMVSEWPLGIARYLVFLVYSPIQVRPFDGLSCTVTQSTRNYATVCLIVEAIISRPNVQGVSNIPSKPQSSVQKLTKSANATLLTSSTVASLAEGTPTGVIRTLFYRHSVSTVRRKTEAMKTNRLSYRIDTKYRMCQH